MADIRHIHSKRVELNDGLLTEQGLTLLATGDSMADVFTAEIYNGGVRVTLSNETITGFFIRPDGATVIITGEVGGGTASVTLPLNCYYYSGHFTLSIAVNDTTVRVIEGTIAKTQSDVVLDNEEFYQMETLVEQINGKLDKPLSDGAEGDVLTADGNGGADWISPAESTVAGTVKVNGTAYTLRTGTAGAAGYMTFVLEG